MSGNSGQGLIVYSTKSGWEPTDDQIAASVEIFLEEVGNDPAIQGLCNNSLDLMRLLGKAMIQAGRAEGYYYTATDGPTLVGYAVVMQPGIKMFGKGQERHLVDFYAGLDPNGKANFDELYQKKFPEFVRTHLPQESLDSVWWIHNLFPVQNGRVMDEILKKIRDDVKGSKPAAQLATAVTRGEDIAALRHLGMRDSEMGRKHLISGFYSVRLLPDMQLTHAMRPRM